MIRLHAAVVATCLVAAWQVVWLDTGQAARGCPGVRARIDVERASVWKLQHELRLPATKVSSVPIRGCAYARWVKELWAARHRRLAVDARAKRAVVRRLNAGLQGTPMAMTGAELEAAGRRHGINPAFIAAIAGTESSFGHAACSSNRFNAYGLANCQGIWHVPDFQSWGQSYRFMAKFLAARWPHANSPYEFYGYAACDACWGRKVASWMRTRFGAAPETTYP